MSWAEQITKLAELKARYFFAIAVIGGLLIFLPANVRQQMAVTIPESVRQWVGLSTLAASVFWLVLTFVQFFSFVQNKISERRLKAEVLGQLETLSQRERDVFLQCLNLNQRTIHRNINDAAANSLRSKRLLAMASQGSVLSMPFTIPKFVWDHIKANDTVLFPELFDEAAMNELAQRQNNHSWMGL